MSRIEAIISDFGGVLTSPLLGSFAAFQDSSGISLEQLGNAWRSRCVKAPTRCSSSRPAE